jgi:hypothetical protein
MGEPHRNLFMSRTKEKSLGAVTGGLSASPRIAARVDAHGAAVRAKADVELRVEDL